VTALIDYFDSDQLQLFKDLCEAYYAGPRDKRHEFMAMKVGGLKRVIQGNGVNRGNDFLWEDLVALMDENLFQYQITSHGFNFVPSPRGRQFYELLMTQAGEQPDQIEDHVWHYFDSQAFERAFPITYGKWREASELVWGSESPRDFSTIGLLCREAMQEFSGELIAKYNVEGATEDKALTRERFSAVVNARRELIGDTASGVLDALFNYWREVGKLMQRQIHAREAQGDVLVWEDGRRLVFQLGFVMFEAARNPRRLASLRSES